MADPPLYRRGKIWWTRIHGRRVSTRCHDRQAGLLAARRLERESADPVYAAAAARTFGAAAADFLEATRAAVAAGDLAQGTLRMYTEKCGHLVRILGVDLPLAQLDAAAVDRHLVTRRPERGWYGGTVSPNTLSKELSSLAQVLKRERRLGRFTRELSQVMPENASPEYQPRRRRHTPEEFERLLAELSPGRAAHVCYVLATCARLSDSFRAERGDVRWSEGIVHVRGTKTEYSDDDVPILPELEPYLRRALRDAPNRGSQGPLFPCWGSSQATMARACERAGVPVVSWNDLRRTVGTWLRKRGVAPHLIGRFLRHGSSQMAERVYARLEAEHLGELLASPAPAGRRRRAR